MVKHLLKSVFQFALIITFSSSTVFGINQSLLRSIEGKIGSTSYSIFYHPAGVEVIDKSYNSASGTTVDLLKTTFVKGGKGEKYLIRIVIASKNTSYFQIMVQVKDNWKEVFRVYGAGMVIQGDGTFTVTGRSTWNIEETHNYNVVDGKFIENDQAIFYSNREVKCMVSSDLYLEPGSKKRVTSIKKGENVIIIGRKGSYFLLRTEAGITGWIYLDPKKTRLPNSPLKQVYPVD